MKNINYLIGDATKPEGPGKKIIAHICNDIGAWGKGFVLAISKVWCKPEEEYRLWSKDESDFHLGEVQFVRVSEDIIIANMIGQKGIKVTKTSIPIRYEEVDKCLKKVADKAKELNATVHMPRIGCGLAGGKWDLIEPLINKNLIKEGIEVFVYDLE